MNRNMNADVEDKLEDLMKDSKARKEKLGFKTVAIPSPKRDFYLPNIHEHEHADNYLAQTLVKPLRMKPALSMPALPKKGMAVFVRSQPESSRLNQSASQQRTNMEESKDLFPNWLRERSDFQEMYQKYNIFDEMDVFNICKKQPTVRNEIEHKAITSWAKTCPFFSEMTEEQLDILADSLKAKQFSKGVTVIRKGEDGDCMYVIVEGRAGVYLSDDRAIDEITAKNVVGEAAMRTNSKRTATIIAHTVLKVLKLMKEDYDRVMYKVKIQEVFQFLKSLPLFADWPLNKLQRLSTMVMVKQYDPEQVVYQINEAPMDLYIVRAGQVDLWMEVSRSKLNRWPSATAQWEMVTTEKVFKRMVRSCKERDVFGEAELLQGVRRVSRAVSATTSLLYLLRVEHFNDNFNEKDRRKLRSTNADHPTSDKLLEDILKDRHRIARYSLALLKALNANSLPSGRGLFVDPGDRKKLTLARRIKSREKKQMAGFIVSQKKVTEKLDAGEVKMLNVTM